MLLGIWRRKLTEWYGRRYRIGVTSMEECLDVIDCFIRGIQNICVRCRNVDKVTGSSVLNLLPDLLHLEVHCFWVKLYRSRDIGNGLMGIVDSSVEQ